MFLFNLIGPLVTIAMLSLPALLLELQLLVIGFDFMSVNVMIVTAGIGLVSAIGAVVIEEFVENATLSRFAQPDEIASVASFLASDESSYMSASFVSVDGGGNTGRYPNLPRAFGQIN